MRLSLLFFCTPFIFEIFLLLPHSCCSCNRTVAFIFMHRRCILLMLFRYNFQLPFWDAVRVSKCYQFVDMAFKWKWKFSARNSRPNHKTQFEEKAETIDKSASAMHKSEFNTGDVERKRRLFCFQSFFCFFLSSIQKKNDLITTSSNKSKHTYYIVE